MRCLVGEDMSYPPALPTHFYNHMVMKMAVLKLEEQMCWFVPSKLNNRNPYFKYLPHKQCSGLWKISLQKDNFERALYDNMSSSSVIAMTLVQMFYSLYE